MKTIYISRNEDEVAQLSADLRAIGGELLSVSMISQRPIAFEWPISQNAEWIFFSSKNGVRYFFAQHPDVASFNLAAVGEGTAEMLSAFGKVQFVGQSSDTSLVATDFASRVGEGRVIFPGARDSLRTIQQAFDPAAIIDIMVYETAALPVYVGFPDVLVFSSPSNVNAFFQLNKVMDFQRIVAFGPSTAAAFRAHSHLPVLILSQVNDQVLLATIKEALES